MLSRNEIGGIKRMGRVACLLILQKLLLLGTVTAQEQVRESLKPRKLGSGWEFQKVIEALQPLIRYSAKSDKGIFGFWDESEVDPPTNLNVDRNWKLKDNPANIRARMLNREEHFEKYLSGAAAVYYRSFSIEAKDESKRETLIHQFWYYFPTGKGRYLGVRDQGFALVELEQVICDGEEEQKDFLEQVEKDLINHKQRLEKLLSQKSAKSNRTSVKAMMEKLDGILSRPLKVPLNYYIDKIYTTSVMHMGDRGEVRVLEYDRKEVRWAGTRPIIYLAEGTHNLVADPKDFIGGDHCDPPYKKHPYGRESLINLHNPHQKANPFPGGANPHGLEFEGCFIEHPLFWLGAGEYLDRKREGRALKSVDLRWSDE